MHTLSAFSIFVGTKCNFKCRHCLHKKKDMYSGLSEKEFSSLQKTIVHYAPDTLFFTGGEPTLYLKDINRIISFHPDPKKLRVSIVTNGYFATTVSAAKKVLASIPNLRCLQLSYDVFHAEYLPFSAVQNTHKACMDMDIEFYIATAIRSPMDLPIVRKIKKLKNTETIVAPVLSMGEAVKNGFGFAYMDFDEKVLNKLCPKCGRVVYICGKGYSMCCANLIFNGARSRIFHKTLETHCDSDFYKMMNTMTFRKIMDKFGVSARGFCQNIHPNANFASIF